MVQENCPNKHYLYFSPKRTINHRFFFIKKLQICSLSNDWNIIYPSIDAVGRWINDQWMRETHVNNAAGSAPKRMCACLVVIGSTCERPFSHNRVVWLGAEPVSSISTLPLRCCCWAWGTKPAVAVSQWSCCRIGDHRRWIDDLLVVSTALPAARSSTTRHFEVLDFLGFDLCMRIK